MSGFGMPVDAVRESAWTLDGSPVAGMRNAKPKPLPQRDVGGATIDVYTVPSGKRLLHIATGVVNPSAGAITVQPKIKISGTYYPIVPSQNPGAGVAIVFNAASMFILEAGDTLAYTVGAKVSGVGLNIIPKLVEFDAASPAKTARLIAPAAGDNQLYQCPLGKRALLTQFSVGTWSQAGTLNFFNNAGGSRTFVPHVTPAGSVVTGTSTRTGAGATLADQAQLTTNTAGSLPYVIAPEETIIINFDASVTNSLLWQTLYELDD